MERLSTLETKVEALEQHYKKELATESFVSNSLDHLRKHMDSRFDELKSDVGTLKSDVGTLKSDMAAIKKHFGIA